MAFSLLALGAGIWILIAIAVIAFIIYFWSVFAVIGQLIFKTLWFLISTPMNFLGKKGKKGLVKIDKKIKRRFT